jgi:hypothetical protein
LRHNSSNTDLRLYPPVPTIPPQSSIGRLNLNPGPVATYFEHLAHEATPKAKAILVKADQVADEVIEGLVVGLTS